MNAPKSPLKENLNIDVEYCVFLGKNIQHSILISMYLMTLDLSRSLLNLERLMFTFIFYYG